VLSAWCPTALALDPALDVSQYAHTAWRSRDGFPKGAVTAIAQTSDGYLWLGTEFGLVRFDGVRFIEWQPPSGDRLPVAPVSRLLVARDGALWIGTRTGLASWKGRTLTRFALPGSGEVTALAQDRHNVIWVGTFGESGDGRLCSIDSDRVACVGDDGRFGLGVSSIEEDPQGRLWVGSATGLWQWRPGPAKQLDASINALAQMPGGPMLVLMFDGGVRKLVDGVMGPLSLGDAAVGRKFTTMRADRDGGLWLGTTTGILHLHEGRVDAFDHSDGLSGDFTNRLFEDREGNVWVSTLGGIDRFREFAIPTTSAKQGLASDLLVSTLAGPDGSVWVATPQGLNHLKDGEITVLRRRFRGTSGRSKEIVDRGIPDDTFTALFADAQARLWASTRGGAAYFEHGRFNAVAGFPTTPAAWCITGDRSGRIWMSHNAGLYVREPDGSVEMLPWSTFGPNSTALAMVEDPASGGLWLGFRASGLALWADHRVVKRYSISEGLPGELVEGLRRDGDGTVWAATSGGLARLKDERITSLDRRHGLPCDAVHWLVEDDARAFWLGMSCGLVRVSRPELDAWIANPSHTVRTDVFDVSDGFASTAVTIQYAPQATKSSDGRIWFVSRDGLGVIDPPHLRLNRLAPPVHVEQVVADGKAYDALAGSVRLPPLVRDVVVDYTALSLAAPEKMHFRYRLEGQDANWREVLNERKVQYSNLAPGRYRFRVTASNNNGVWNEQGAALDIEIAPAFWQTNWFRALCAAAFALLLFGLYRLRVHQLRRRFALTLETRVAERTRIARDLHDTLLQSFHGLLLRFQTVSALLPGRPAEAKSMLDSAIDQAAEAITEGRDAVQALRTSTTEMNNLAASLRTLGGDLRAQQSADAAAIRVEVLGVTRALHPIVRDEVFRIAAEALRNALRHAASAQIEVEIVYDRSQFRLRVRDDGKGIDPQLLAQGRREGHFGLEGMRERAGVVGGKLTVWSALDAGTEIELTVPASNAYVAGGGDDGPSGFESV